MIAPTLKTERVTLRAHEMEDLEAFQAFYASPRAAYVAAPSDASDGWYRFASEVGSWALAGYGGWAIEVDGTLAGQVSFIHPPHFPELELGWILFDGFEGRGIAFEAASLARDYGFGPMGADTFVSYIDRDNARSIALAQRLGAVEDPGAATYDDVDVVYRHRRQP